MNTLKQSQQRACRLGNGSRHLVAGFGKIIGGLVAIINAIAVFCEANDAFEQSLSFEERLQRTGRIRYR